MAQYVTNYYKDKDGKIRKQEPAPAAKKPKVEETKEEKKNVKGQ